MIAKRAADDEGAKATEAATELGTGEVVPDGGVLVAVDGSDFADRALSWAVTEAQSRGAALVVAHCFHWPSPGLGAMDAVGFLMDALAEDSTDILRRAVDTVHAAAPDLAVYATSQLGAPIPTLVQLSRGRDLVVVGSRGLGGFVGMLLGSVSSALVTSALCPVVVVRGEREPAAGDPVVVGVDESPMLDAVLTEAFGAAERRGCKLVAVHAWQGPAADLRTARGNEPLTEAELAAAWQRSVAADLAERLARVGSRFGSVSAEAVTVRERPAAALLARAATAQLVVVGTRGRGELRGMLLGSTSRALVQHAECPVLVVRTTQD